MSCRAGPHTLALLAVLASLAIACGGDSSTPPDLSQPAKLTLVSGDGQSGNGSALPTPLVVRVTDPRDGPVAGVAITWSTSDATASLTGTTTTTDEQGQAKTNWMLGTSAGRQTVTATTPALPGAQAVFQATSGGVLSGGVTVQSAPPVAFSALSRGGLSPSGLSASGLSANAVRARMIVQPSNAARQLATAGMATRRLIVEFRETATATRATVGRAAMRSNVGMMQQALATHVASHRVTRAELSPAVLAARVTVPDGVAMQEAAAALRADASIASVTEDRVVSMLAPYAAFPATPVRAVGEASTLALAGGMPGLLPNDPILQPTLWHYNLVDAPRGWSRATGSRSVLVAVVDNGIRFDHPAMGVGAASNLTHDGYNFVTGGDRLSAPEPVCQGGTTTLPEAGPGADPTQPDDLIWFGDCWYRNTLGNHGLHVAGTIGAVGNDGIGIAGLNWQVSIRPVRVLDITGSGSYFDIAQGVLYAAGLPASNGTTTVQAATRAAIINMSLGGSATSSVLANAITAATNAGSLIVASAGNGETFSPSYPAAYPEVLAVSAVGPDLSISSYTNVGGNVSLAAPGGNFRSSGSSGVASSVWDYVANAPTYAYYEGTSMSAPHVTGVAALVLAANPGLTNAQLRSRLQSTAVHVGAPGRNDQYGYGIVNAYNALTNSTGPARTIQVRVVNAATGALAQQVAANADGSFSVSRLPVGSYYLYAGHDEDGDGRIGVPGRRFGWYGGLGGPQAITIGAGGNASASLSIGTPSESKPHNTAASANRLVVNSYMVGQITATDPPAMYVVQLPATGTYYFEAGGVLGSCGFGIEMNTVLELQDANGASLATSDNAGLPGGSFCSAISGHAIAGTYYLKVSGAPVSSNAPPAPTGQYRVWVRDAP
jgi:subtilisin family serine protease